ncbi:sensor histidine kinase [Chitinophaga pinensis]|uniref:histidine kinase n=1 Tax=Chitinophaga pinensis (strain ATCC 43595 / DSM 2588 / LMG 13176 / NBRC 15968 / NCIMB 11800 / UQM 2034) TaxID=485918 RepID=A0A979G2E3_CHIPD|nr:ATP-binding protein [Chitinophaga pinensis]ACU59546.1 histidine kinase [Chitinophaga pinensis DSM 2588]
MTQLFRNLISNALKFNSRDKNITISITARALNKEEIKELQELDQHADYYAITILDNGIGFDQAYAEKIFNIFQRLYGNKDYTGTGVSLAMCKEIVLSHNGVFMHSLVRGMVLLYYHITWKKIKRV